MTCNPFASIISSEPLFSKCHKIYMYNFMQLWKYYDFQIMPGCYTTEFLEVNLMYVCTYAILFTRV